LPHHKVTSRSPNIKPPKGQMEILSLHFAMEAARLGPDRG
jgi:hypothetical protein